MMKKVLTIALAMFALAACKNNPGAATGASSEGRSVETVYDIAYISMDSLVTGYNRYKDLSAEFETKAARAQSDLESRARTLQNDIMNFQDRMQRGLMTRSQAEEQQAQLERRSSEFDQNRQDQLTLLAEEEQVITNRIMYAISDYVADFNSDYRFKMILTSSSRTPVLHADPALDITAEILKGLNAAYAAEQAAAKK